MPNRLDDQTDDALINHGRFYSLMCVSTRGVITRLRFDLTQYQEKDRQKGYPKGRDTESMETWSIRQAIYIETLKLDYWKSKRENVVNAIRYRALDVHTSIAVLLQEYHNE